MDEETGAAVVSSVAEAVDTAAAVQAVEIAAPIVEAAIEHAEQRVAAAEDAATAIADAAVQTALGQQVNNLERNIETWRAEQVGNQQTMEMELNQLRGQMTEMQAALSEAKGLLTQLIPPQQPEPAPLVPTTTTITPEQVVQSAVDENPVAGTAPRVRKRRWS